MLGLKVDDTENINTWHAKSTISAMEVLQECAEWIDQFKTVITEISYGYLMHKMTRTITKTVILGV